MRQYFNDTQEIDLEFLSSQLNATSSPVNLVLHSSLSLQDGNDASRSPTFKVVQLPFKPDEGFHEYRFDWTPDKVSFFADGKLLVEMTQDIPVEPGHIAISHWSNGNELWSGGPPKTDAVMTVSYIKGYFNSSLPSRQSDYHRRCTNPNAANAVCVVPDQLTAPDPSGPNGNSTASTYFFSENHNKTNNQTVYSDKKKGGAASLGGSFWLTLVITAAVATFI